MPRSCRRGAVLVLSGLVLVAGASQAQEKGEPKEQKVPIPPAVEKAFKAAYPKAVIKGTTKETEDGRTVYEVESIEQGRTRDLLYTIDGAVVEIEEQVDDNDVPAAVMQAIKSRYPKARLTKNEKLTKGSTIAYEFQVKGADVKEFVLGPDGTWVKPPKQ